MEKNNIVVGVDQARNENSKTGYVIYGSKPGRFKSDKPNFVDVPKEYVLTHKENLFYQGMICSLNVNGLYIVPPGKVEYAKMILRKVSKGANIETV